MEEEWRDIKGYEGLYQISNLGRVYSYHKGDCLNLNKDKDGYLVVGLHKNGKKKPYSVHRLVAKNFIENPNNLPQINHKDENKSNNRVDNLEWCTARYNSNYGTRNERVSRTLKGRNMGINYNSRKVQCITTGKKFNTIKEAGEYYYLNNSIINNITTCCKGEKKSAGKHPVTGEKLVWKYID